MYGITNGVQVTHATNELLVQPVDERLSIVKRRRRITVNSLWDSFLFQYSEEIDILEDLTDV